MNVELQEKLLVKARQAAERAYAPYSNFRVGSAVITASGRIYQGCNIENASFGLTVCAERAAIFHAISAGEKKLSALAVICLDAPSEAAADYLMPCGPCRQVLAEFLPADAFVLVAGFGVLTVAQLLPMPFRLAARPTP